ncbi:hypothetical protein ACFC0C_02815 [Streptomyces sp. NPDC056178]
MRADRDAPRRGEVVDGARNDDFGDGLACVLDGLEARLPGAGRSAG